MSDVMDFEEVLTWDEGDLKAALTDLTALELEQVIIEFDKAEAKRWQRELVNDQFNKVVAQEKAAKVLNSMSDVERAALVQEIKLQGIENPFKTGKVGGGLDDTSSANS